MRGSARRSGGEFCRPCPELPALAAVLDPLWGRITRITVNPPNGRLYRARVTVAGHVVKTGWFRGARGGVGRGRPGVSRRGGGCAGGALPPYGGW
ncbi:DUF5994 family protein [Streptomyces albogriseolus]|uniref:DUF5994 family protein n=1 Tax=Streptomyces albogriseolus TaxID=1887 RepID=UPI003F4CB3BA